MKESSVDPGLSYLIFKVLNCYENSRTEEHDGKGPILYGWNHIVDPRTGLSPELSTSVSVMAPTAMDADAMSTTAFVMNPSHAIRFIDSVPGCESLVIAKGGKKLKSLGWKSAAI